MFVTQQQLRSNHQNGDQTQGWVNSKKDEEVGNRMIATIDWDIPSSGVDFASIHQYPVPVLMDKFIQAFPAFKNSEE